MTKKIARRWLNQNKWNIAKWNLGFFKEGITQFSRQYFICKRAMDSIANRQAIWDYEFQNWEYNIDCPVPDGWSKAIINPNKNK